MFGYANDIRSATAGRGNYGMTFSRYAILPTRLIGELGDADELVALAA